MKITAIETHVCHARQANWVFVRILTDQQGLWGWGEATLPYHTRSLVGAIKDLATLIVGQDPLRVEHLWQTMSRQQHSQASGLVRSTAQGSIDMALWDIAGKVRGLPCYELWGGALRDHLRAYCHLGGVRAENYLRRSDEDQQRFAQLAVHRQRDGFNVIKASIVPPISPLEGMAVVDQAVDILTAMRRATSNYVEFILDFHSRPSLQLAQALLKALEPLGVLWVENPCQGNRPADLAHLQRNTSLVIGAGDSFDSAYAFAQLLEQRGCSLVQPNVAHCGGLTVARRVAALAETYGLPLSARSHYGPVNLAASVQLGFSTACYSICEVVYRDIPWRGDIIEQGCEFEPKRGVLLRCNRPGLGIEINLDEVHKHPFAQETPVQLTQSDGSLLDW